MIGSTRKTSPRASRVKSGIRVLWIAACLLIVVTPRLSADIIVVDRLWDARANASNYKANDVPPLQRDPSQYFNSLLT